jgi:predicted RNA binding protein YcfA (HicA-like mRNA interferase family)
VKRRELVRHLEQHGCRLLREGSNHTLYVSPEERKMTTVSRHREINEYLALGVPER